MKSIIQAFSEHGTFVQPNTLDYILSKENPEEFTTYLTKELKEYPLVLTLDHVKKIEETKDNDKISNPSDDFLKNKEIQSKILFNLYNPELKPKENIIENDSDQELIYVDDLSLDFKELPKIDITSKSFEVNNWEFTRPSISKPNSRF